MGETILLITSFAIILAGALLFTNAVEWAGHKLDIGEGATGSLLAAVGTAMPETLIPIVAMIGGAEGSNDVAIGAIVGAPFLLATIAMALVGATALAYRERRPQGRALNAHAETLERDLVVFMIFFGFGVALGIGVPDAIQIPAAVVLVIGYIAYVRRTLLSGGAVQEFDTLEPLIVQRASFGSSQLGNPSAGAIVLQLLVGLGAMVGGAHLFVEELIHVAESLGTTPLVLSLVLAPLATELPEKANSFFWVRDGKDSLALGNITGAMVFQSMLPIALGLLITDWELSDLALLSGGLGVIGGAVAYLALRRRGEFTGWAVATWAVLYAAFIVAVVA